MTYARIMDAAYPPASLYPETTGVLGYIGGAATHVWTAAEWLRFQHARQFPCWVAAVGGKTTGTAHDHGTGAVAAARKLGWAPDMPGASNRAIIVDMETAVDRAFYAEVADIIDAGGFTAICYGSASTVLQNAAADIVIAEWVDSVVAPPIPAGQTLRGLQYDGNVSYDGTQIDLSVFSPWLMARAGVGPRHA